MEWAFIDCSYAKAHQHSAGAISGDDEAIGKIRAGNTSKIHLVVAGTADRFELGMHDAGPRLQSVPRTRLLVAFGVIELGVISLYAQAQNFPRAPGLSTLVSFKQMKTGCKCCGRFRRLVCSRDVR